MSELFHAGEIALQERVGVREKIALLGPRVIQDEMSDQHQNFFRQLPFIVIGAVDATGQVWASILVGSPGFLQPVDSRRLAVRGRFIEDDPLHGQLVHGSQVGLLGIEPHTRRRNRLNGFVQSVSDNGFVVQVVQSFGNCPKYITQRKARHRSQLVMAHDTLHLKQLDAEAIQLIANADTFFIATALSSEASETARGADVSHRGGSPGFVQVHSEDQLTIPDFSGNSVFNSLGNIALNPRVGLLFIDHATGNLLYLAGFASIEWQDSFVQNHPPRTQRLLHFNVHQLIRIRGCISLVWD
jgi:uncharacterized protein